MEDQGFDENTLLDLVAGAANQPGSRSQSKQSTKAPPNLHKFQQEAAPLKNIQPQLPSLETSMEEEVRQAEMESRLRRMITEVLKPSIVKVTRLQTDHELMCQKFQEMIDGHQQVLNAQKEAKEHSEVIGVFRGKLEEFWTFSNSLEDKISSYQKSAVTRMEELDQSCELNKSSLLRLGRNLDRALQDMDRVNASIKAMQLAMEKGIQKNKESMDKEIKQIQSFVGEIRELHNKLEIEVWGPEDCSDISPPCLRKLDMQMKKQTALVAEAIDDIHTLQRLDGELMEVTKRQGVAEGQLAALQNTSTDLGERVETCALEAKADFKQASNLMAAFSANLVREARTSFKDELKHAQEMQKDVDDFVRQTQASLAGTDEFVRSLSKQLEAMVREVRFDLDSYDQKRHRDKQGLEEQMREVQSKIGSTIDSSEFLLKGLEHVSGVISMSLQSERMSVALDLQDYVDRKDTPYVGIHESKTEKTARLRQVRAERGSKKILPGVDPEALHKILYQPQAIDYQGNAFERHQLLALREKLVHVAQEVLQQGPEAKRRMDASPDNLLATLVNTRVPSAEQTARPGSRSSTPARPGSRGQPGARGSPLLEAYQEGTPRELRQSPDGSLPYEKDVDFNLSGQVTLDDLPGTRPGTGGPQLPVLAAPARQGSNADKKGSNADRSKVKESPAFTPITDTRESLDSSHEFSGSYSRDKPLTAR